MIFRLKSSSSSRIEILWAIRWDSSFLVYCLVSSRLWAFVWAYFLPKASRLCELVELVPARDTLLPLIFLLSYIYLPNLWISHSNFLLSFSSLAISTCMRVLPCLKPSNFCISCLNPTARLSNLARMWSALRLYDFYSLCFC